MSWCGAPPSSGARFEAAGAAALALAWHLGCGSGAFTCEDASDCADGDRTGTCQLDGFCSFPDDGCPSGQRYGAHAGSASGECVPDTTSGTTGGEPTTMQPGPESNDSGDPGTLVTTEAVDSGTGDASTTLPVTSDPTTDSGPVATESSTGETSSTGPELALWLRFEDADFARGLVDDGPWALSGSCPTACPTSVPGYIGNGARFDGVTHCVVVPHDAAFTDLEAVTLSAFVRLDPMPPFLDAHMIVGKPVGVDDRDSFELFMSDNDLTDEMMRANVAISDDATFTTVNAPQLSPSEEWIHVAGTWDGATVTLWINGEAVDSGAQPTMAIDDHAVFVGCDDDGDDAGDDNVFAGEIDEVRIYRELLSAEQIAALAAGDEP